MRENVKSGEYGDAGNREILKNGFESPVWYCGSYFSMCVMRGVLGFDFSVW